MYSFDGHGAWLNSKAFEFLGITKDTEPTPGGKIVAPLMLILGVMTRYAAAIFTFTMLFATYLVMDGKVLALTPQGSWALELQAIYLCGGFCMLFLGGGKYSVMSEFSSRR